MLNRRKSDPSEKKERASGLGSKTIAVVRVRMGAFHKSWRLALIHIQYYCSVGS